MKKETQAFGDMKAIMTQFKMPGIDMAAIVEARRKGFENAFANMKELAEMARHAQSDAMTRITQRATGQMQVAKSLVTPK